MPSVAEAIAKAPSKLRPVLLELAEALRADRIEVLEARLGAVERTLTTLAEAQARTETSVRTLEEKVEALAEAQARTETSVQRLAEAQARTETSVRTLEEKVEALAEAQARTETSVQRLAEAQARTETSVRTLEEKVEALAEAQARTETSVQHLAEAQARTERTLADLARQVGGLSDTIGFTLEEMGRIRVHDYLERREFQLPEIDRRTITTDRAEVDFDLYAEGTAAGEQVVIVGEVKSRISEREAGLFLERLDLVSAAVPPGRRLVPVLFGFLIHPRARLLVQGRGGFAIESYQR